MNSSIVNKLIPELSSNRKIRKLGIHFHRKTQNTGEWDLSYEIKNVLEIESLEKLDMINIGGGLPVKYKNTNDDALETIFSMPVAPQSGHFGSAIRIPPEMNKHVDRLAESNPITADYHLV